MSQKEWTDLRIEIIIGSLLRIGVMSAAAVVLIGAVVYLARHGHDITHYTTFQGEPAALKGVGPVAEGIITLHAGSIIQFGLLLLIATPVARVAFAAVAFALEKDYLYVVITLIVLAILLYSLFGSGG